MELELNGKLALITGSTRGIGFAIAKSLLEEGCRVILNGRNESRLYSAAEQLPGKVDIFVGDTTDESVCKKMANEVKKKYETLDILVTNVGSGRSVPPGNETANEWKRVLELNLISATNIIHAFSNILTKNTGSVVSISSICGQEALGAPLTYSAAKAALNSYIIGVARVLGENGIRINAIAPGNILDEGGTWERKLAEDKNAVETMLKNEVALRRLGKPEEIADFVTFLVSDKAAFATGSIFTVDGGQVRS